MQNVARQFGSLNRVALMVLAVANALEVYAEYALGWPNTKGFVASLSLTQRRCQLLIKTWLKTPGDGLMKWWWD
ncbi:MAG: hypothetical protein ACRBBO_02070 [Cognatishimia sp.]